MPGCALNRPGNDAAYRPSEVVLAFLLLVLALSAIAVCVIGGFRFLLLLAGH